MPGLSICLTKERRRRAAVCFFLWLNRLTKNAAIDNKMKAILPTLKQKKRYMAFEVVSREAIQSYDEIKRTILEAGLSFLGELGMAEAGIRIIDDDYDPKRQRGLIKVNHKHVDKLDSALMMIRKVGRQDAVFRCVGISGIMGKAEKRYIYV